MFDRIDGRISKESFRERAGKLLDEAKHVVIISLSEEDGEMVNTVQVFGFSPADAIKAMNIAQESLTRNNPRNN